jgi:excisionase family DNA binding protein
MNQTGGLMGQSTPGIATPQAPAAAAASAAPALLTPAQAAEMLGVAEADVLASLDAGDLKGKKIGTQWRITRDAIDAFLKS